MSTQSKTPNRKPYVVTATGPINIDGTMRRKDDAVSLTAAQAQSYAPHIKPAPKPAAPATPPAKSSKPAG